LGAGPVMKNLNVQYILMADDIGRIKYTFFFLKTERVWLSRF